MGEAKRRGTYEKRRVTAIERDAKKGRIRKKQLESQPYVPINLRAFMAAAYNTNLDRDVSDEPQRG